MRTTFFLFLFTLLTSNAQDLTHNNRKVILNSPNTVSLFQSNSTNGIWASGMITGDRWGIFEDATISKEHLTILPGGNVGIGRTNPSEVLDVNGNIIANRMIKIDGHGTVASLQIMDNSNTSTLDILLRGDDGKSYIKNGNVGIGTTTPDYKLVVQDATNNQLSLINTTGNSWQFRAGSTGSLIFRDDNVERIRINSSGNMGIGTSNPGTYRLAVKGKIRAEEIKVETGWADYVFKEDYILPTLEEVEKHITEKGHLINIPSAEEVVANGIQLGEMNKLLLEKIEELTLYTLEQEKKLQLQDDKLQQIKIILNQLTQNKN